MRDSSIRNRSGHRYKPSVIRSYDDALRAHVLDHLGALRLGDIKRRDSKRSPIASPVREKREHRP